MKILVTGSNGFIAKNLIQVLSEKSDVEVLKSQIEQANIAVENATVNLGYTQITSPLNGVIVSIPVEEGQTVNSNQTTVILKL